MDWVLWRPLVVHSIATPERRAHEGIGRDTGATRQGKMAPGPAPAPPPLANRGPLPWLTAPLPVHGAAQHRRWGGASGPRRPGLDQSSVDRVLCPLTTRGTHGEPYRSPWGRQLMRCGANTLQLGRSPLCTKAPWPEGKARLPSPRHPPDPSQGLAHLSGRLSDARYRAQDPNPAWQPQFSASREGTGPNGATRVFSLQLYPSELSASKSAERRQEPPRS